MAGRWIGRIGTVLVLGLAGVALSQAPQPLEYSRKTMSLGENAFGRPDTILIKNPNTVDLRCDSIVLLLGASRLGGAYYFQYRSTDSANLNYLLAWEPLSAGTHPDSAKATIRFPYNGTRLEFPRGKRLLFIWNGYDPCPVCKVSAASGSADSVRFRMVFHLRSFADTLEMAIDRRLTVGLRNPGAKETPRAAPSPVPERNLLGRRLPTRGPADGPEQAITWKRTRNSAPPVD